eukprot:g7819.t1
MLPRRSARVGATTFDDSPGSTGTLDAMEIGEQPQQDSSEQRVIVAATEVLELEGTTREHTARSRRLLAQAVRVVLQGLVVGFGCFCAYDWVDSFRKGRFNESLGVVTVMFVGITICAWGCRRQLMPLLRPEAEGRTAVAVGRELQQRPKDDNPPQTRQGFDYFVYPELASSSTTGSETSVSCSDDDSGINIASDAFKSAAAFTDIEAPTVSNSGNGVDDESAASSVQAPATAPSVAQEPIDSSESCGAGEGDGAASLTPSPTPPPPPSETKDDESCEETKEDQQRETTTAKTTGSFSWTPTATPTECMVCLESYTAGDRVCRIPCGHAFHAECIENWLEQNPSCPECRLKLQSSTVEVIRQAPPSSPASVLPDNAFQASFSSGGGGDDVSSPPTSTTAAAQPPATSPSDTRRRSGNSTTPPAAHPDLFSTSRAYGSASAVASAPNADPLARQRQLSSDPGRATTATPTTTTTTPERAHARAVANSSVDMTEINTVINASTAPFARYFGGSPVTEGPASPTFSVVRFVGLSPEPGQQGHRQLGTAAAHTPDTAATPEPSSLRAPFACFFDSPPCNQSPLRGGAGMSQSSLPAASYAPTLDSPDFDRPTDLGWSPYSPGSSDPGEGNFVNLTELNTAINAIANDSQHAVNSAAVAPFARYFESFESPTSILRFAGPSQEYDPQDVAPYRSAASPALEDATSSPIVPFRPPGASAAGPAPFARYLESPSYYSASPLSTANFAHFPLSPNFMRTPRAADHAEPGDTTAPHRISPYFPPVPFRRRPQQQQQHVGTYRRNGEDDERAYQAYFGAIESTSPPRAPPRLVYTPSPALERRGSSRAPTQPAFPVQPTGGTASSPFAAESGREKEEVTGLGSPTSWVWPLSSASIWDNKAWPTIGGRVRIDSLEGASVHHEGRGRNNARQDQEGVQPAMPPPVLGGRGGRWVWQEDEPNEL